MCFKCGMKGHYANKCGRCTRCGEVGHMRPDCQDRNKNIRCRRDCIVTDKYTQTDPPQKQQQQSPQHQQQQSQQATSEPGGVYPRLVGEPAEVLDESDMNVVRRVRFRKATS